MYVCVQVRVCWPLPKDIETRWHGCILVIPSGKLSSAHLNNGRIKCQLVLTQFTLQANGSFPLQQHQKQLQRHHLYTWPSSFRAESSSISLQLGWSRMETYSMVMGFLSSYTFRKAVLCGSIKVLGMFGSLTKPHCNSFRWHLKDIKATLHLYIC